MKYSEFVKDYSEYVNQLKKLTNNECEKSDKKQKIFVNHLDKSDFVPGIKIYAGELGNAKHVEKLTIFYHVYTITYIRGNICFYIRDNEFEERIFAFGSIMNSYMFPMKISIGEENIDNFEVDCECPLVKIVKNEI